MPHQADNVDWRTISASAQGEVLNAIPKQWRLSSDLKKTTNFDARSVPKDSGLLSLKQLEITELTATELLEAIHNGRLTAVDATEAFCARAAIAHQMVNCMTAYFPQEALQTARALDEAFAAQGGKPKGPLHGLPIAIKDMYDVQGRKTTLGYVSWFLKPLPQNDSALVTVMKDVGAIVFAKTTMPQTVSDLLNGVERRIYFALDRCNHRLQGMALETVSNLWGRTLNPFNSSFGSGGSSGGDGALVAMKGAPIAPLSSDIGGSIRAPAAFNGLYGIRPSSDRVPRSGLQSTAPGQISIKISCGPCAQSMADLKLVTRQIVTHPTLPCEPSCVPGWWNDVAAPTEKLSFGLMLSDGVVEPHPPVRRALLESAERLRAQGHEVLDFSPPFSCWDAALTTWALYFQTGAKEAKAAIAATGESTIPAFQFNLDVFKTRELTVPELFKLNTQQAGFKASFANAWTATQSTTSTGRPMDGLLCPSAAGAGFPHEFPQWWGYTTLWNLLDYPSVIIPLKGFRIDEIKDAKDLGYKPRDNAYDTATWEIYDPKVWRNQPVTMQVVGRPCRDEDLIALCESLDGVIY